MTKIPNAGRTIAGCIAALLLLAIAPAACSANGGIRPSGDTVTSVAGAYGAFCVSDAKGRTFDVCAACFVQEDGYADLYLVKDASDDARLTAESWETESLEIDAVRWFVGERCAGAEVLFKHLPLRAVYEQPGTLQTIGTGGAPARLIWAKP